MTKGEIGVEGLLWAVAGLAGVAVALVLIPTMAMGWLDQRGYRTVRCPGTRGEAHVRTSPMRGALANVGLPVRLRVLSCSVWPERRDCAQQCLAA